MSLRQTVAEKKALARGDAEFTNGKRPGCGWKHFDAQTMRRQTGTNTAVVKCAGESWD